MRTTIELPEEQRTELLRIAAQKGQKGFSGIIQQAVQMYLDQNRSQEESLSQVLKLKGSFKGKDAEEFETLAKSARENWR